MSAPADSQGQSIYRHMVAGSLWAIALRWGLRCIGLVSVALLARLLTPADFGIVAMGSLLVGVIGVLTDMGTPILLLRLKEVTRADCDTAWTISLIQGVVVAIVLLASGPLAVQYFSEPRLQAVIYMLALCAVIGATNNIGMTLVRRDLDFARDFRFGIYKKLSAFVATIGLAIWWRDYWALVVGGTISAVVNVLISYRMHPYRPRLSLANARQYVSFSVGMILWNVGGFLKSKIDVLVVGARGDAAVTGSYNVASELATMATYEVVLPVWRGLFPTFSKIVHDRERFLEAYGHFVATMAILCFPLGLGLWAVAEECVLVVLGPQWAAVVVPLKWLAIAATLLAMIDVFGGNVLFVTGYERRSALLMWVHLAVLAPAVVVAGKIGTVEAIAIAATFAAAVQLPIALGVMIRSIGFSLGSVVRVVWRPGVAVAVMLTVIAGLPTPAAWPAILRLAGMVTLGAGVYVSCLIALWMAAGRPEGLESRAWNALAGVLRERRHSH